MPNPFLEYDEPIRANWSRSFSSALISAPTSNITLKPLGPSDGHNIEIAGRLIPGIIRNLIIETASNAPVFPQETQASASFCFTDVIADHIDVPLPVRIT